MITPYSMIELAQKIQAVLDYDRDPVQEIKNKGPGLDDPILVLSKPVALVLHRLFRSDHVTTLRVTVSTCFAVG